MGSGSFFLDLIILKGINTFVVSESFRTLGPGVSLEASKASGENRHHEIQGLLRLSFFRQD